MHVMTEGQIDHVSGGGFWSNLGGAEAAGAVFAAAIGAEPVAAVLAAGAGFDYVAALVNGE